MTDTRKAAELAKDIKDAVLELSDGHRFPDLMEAIDQLAALSQPAEGQEPGAQGVDLSDDQIDHEFAVCLDQIAEIKGVEHAMYVNTDCANHSTLRRMFARRIADLARPAAQPVGREALSEEQIVTEALRPCYTSASVVDWFEAGARFAERAHGITMEGV